MLEIERWPANLRRPEMETAAIGMGVAIGSVPANWRSFSDDSASETAAIRIGVGIGSVPANWRAVRVPACQHGCVISRLPQRN
jgi:hypothetical protein